MTRYQFAGLIALVAMVACTYFFGVSPVSAGTALMLGAVVQSTYSERMPVAYAGMIANMTNWDADTRICETAAGIGFGLAVGKGTGDKGAVLGATLVTDFLGITIRDITLVNATADKYAQYQNMAVLTEGDLWVTVGGNVADGEDVTFNGTTGVLSSTAAGAGQFLITGARWQKTAINGALSVVRLSGHLPSV
jgi:hypothetical protein